MKDGQRIARNAALMFGKQGVMALLGVVFVGYLARKVGVADWGEFQASLALANVVTVVAGVGVRGYLAREIAVTPSLGARHLGSALAIRGVTGIVLLGGTVAVALASRTGLASVLLALAAVSQLATLMYSTMWLSFEAHERFQHIVVAEISARVLVIGTASLLLYAGFGIVAAAAAFMFGNVFELAVTYWLLQKHLYKPRLEADARALARIAWFSVPLGLCGAVATALQQSDRVLLRWLVGESAVGIYSAAWVLTESFTMIPDVFLASAFAAGMRLFANDRDGFARLFDRCFLFAAMVGLPIAAGVVVIAPDLVHLIYGARFQGSVVVLRVLVCQVPVIFAHQVGTLPLLAGKREKTIVWLLAAMLVADVALNVVLAPRFGPVGAAMTSLVVACGGLAGTLVLNRAWLRHVRWGAFSSVALSTAGMACCAWAARATLGMWAAIVAGIASYVGLVLATRAVTWAELKTLLRKNAEQDADIVSAPPSRPAHARG